MDLLYKNGLYQDVLKLFNFVNDNYDNLLNRDKETTKLYKIKQPDNTLYIAACNKLVNYLLYLFVVLDYGLVF